MSGVLTMIPEYVMPIKSRPSTPTVEGEHYRLHRRALIAGDPKAHQIELDVMAKRTTLAEQYPLDEETLLRIANHQRNVDEFLKTVDIKGVNLKGSEE